MEQVMETVRETGSRVLDALCETGKAVVGFFTGLVKSVSCSAAKLVKVAPVRQPAAPGTRPNSSPRNIARSC